MTNYFEKRNEEYITKEIN